MNTPSAMGEFDLCGPLPHGVTLLEASAGTGKTFAVAALVTQSAGSFISEVHIRPTRKA